jgi:sugar phosphate isomerase/epimerase
MDVSQVAAQLYTVRDHAKTADDLAATFHKLREIGYQAVQLIGLDLPPADIAKMMADAGLTCCSAHENSQQLLDDPQAVAERLHILGSTSAAFPHPGSVKLDTLDDVKALAARLNGAGEVLHDARITFCYHNHSIEFRRFDGRLMLDVIYQETDPRYLQGEPDTFWIQVGGGDPVEWCRKLKDRLPVLHLKDYMITPESRPTFAEIGRGNLNWKAIIAAAEQSGCQWYVVEQDTCEGDPFDSLRMSFDYIRDNLCA